MIRRYHADFSFTIFLSLAGPVWSCMHYALVQGYSKRGVHGKSLQDFYLFVGMDIIKEMRT